jgi:hypothetical protein
MVRVASLAMAGGAIFFDRELFAVNQLTFELLVIIWGLMFAMLIWGGDALGDHGAEKFSHCDS